MATPADHNRLIAQAAKTALAPIGCRRKGRSRLWYLDRGYWLILIEFQPSSFSKGSYLNVGPQWLWGPEDSLWVSDDDDNRVQEAGFIDFENSDQFKPLITRVADLAAQEALRITDEFKSLDAIAHRLSMHATQRRIRLIRTIYSAAVATGLAGDIAQSGEFFQRLRQWPAQFDWEKAHQREGARLASLLSTPDVYRAEIFNTVNRNRELKGLPTSAVHF